MLFEFVKTKYRKYKTISFICLLMFMVKGIITQLVKEIDRRVPENSVVDNEGHYVRYVDDGNEEDTDSRQEILETVIDYFSFIIKVSLIFGGIWADRYGGHWMIFLGLVTGTFLVFMAHLSLFINRIMLTVMLVLTRTVQIVIEISLFSLAGKIALPDQRTISVSAMFASSFFGKLAFRVIKHSVANVLTLSEIAVFISFITAIWWWMIFRRPTFPLVRKLPLIPWKDIIKSKSFYFNLLLLCSTYFYGRYFIKSITAYLKDYSSELRPIHESSHINAFHSVPIFSVIICGVATDFIISRGYLSSSKTRKCFVILSIALFSITLLSSRYIHESTDQFLGHYFAVKFTGPFMEATVVAISLELSPMCCGTIFGIYFVIYQIFILATELLVPEKAYRLEDINILEIFIIVVLASLPFLFFKYEEKKWGEHQGSRTSTSTETEDDIDQEGSPE